jgi:hypothetical protein
LPDEAININNYDVTTKTFKNPSAWQRLNTLRQ